MGILTSIWTWLIGALMGAWGFVKLVVVYEVRLRESNAGLFMGLMKEGKFLRLSEEITPDPLPRELSAVGILYGCPIVVSFTERIMHTGFSATETVCRVTCLRLQKKKVLSWFQSKSKTPTQAFILEPWDVSPLCTLHSPREFHTDIYPLYSQMDTLVSTTLTGGKGGMILYGPPGNGKSLLVKHFATKYDVPLYIVSLRSDYSNDTFLRMFARLQGPGIVLFEDFDNVFDKRKNLLVESKFTLDAILNVLDGAFLNLDKLVFIMTANDIDKIDYALKNRPSRFSIAAEIGNPSSDIKLKYLNSPYFIDKAISVDEMFFIKDNLRTESPETIEQMLLSLREVRDATTEQQCTDTPKDDGDADPKRACTPRVVD